MPKTNWLAIVAGGVAFGAAVPRAHATVLFHDDFESSPATPFTLQQQLSNPSLQSDHDPINTTGAPGAAAPGQWFHYAKTSTPPFNIQVTSNVDDPASGSYQGSNVLRLRRSAEPPSSTAAMAAYIGQQTSGIIRATWKMMIPHQYALPFEPYGITFPVHFFFTPYADNDHSEGTSPDGMKTPVVILDSPLYTPPTWARVYHGGFPFSSGGGSIELNSPSTGDPQIFTNQWQQYELEANIDTQKFTLTVDGITAGPFDFNFAGGFSALTFRVAQAQAQLDNTITGRFFIDDLLIVRQDPHWNVDADGNWSNPANWDGSVPNGEGQFAEFGSVITAPRTVTVDGPKTVGGISFDNANAYTLAGSDAITLDAAASATTAFLDVISGSHTIAAPVVLADDLLVTVRSVSSTLQLTGPLTAGSKSVNKVGPGALQLEGLITTGGLNIPGGTLRISSKATANDSAGTTRVNSLSMGSASRLDLNNNSLIINSGSLATVTSQIKTALENGGNFDWLGPGIGSTQANVQNTTAGSFLYGLGVILNDLAQVGGSGPIYTDFAGQTLTGNEILVKFTYFGDADLSGSIDATDYSLIDNGYVNSLSGWLNGDFDYSGSIDATDYALIDNAYVNQVGPLANAIIAEHARMLGGEYLAALRAIQSGVIPEPESLGLLACISVSLRRPRCRRL